MRMLRYSLLLAGCLVVAASVAAWAGDTQTIAYPTADEAAFLIDVPADWELAQAEEDGDYFSVEGPNGTILYFRTLNADNSKERKTALMDAIQETKDYIDENYDESEWGEAVDLTLGGCEGFGADVKAVGSDSGEAVDIGCAWLMLPEYKIAEIWYEGSPDEAAEAEAAAQVLKSFRLPSDDDAAAEEEEEEE